MPASLDLGPLWEPKAGSALITEDFTGQPGELATTTTTTGGLTWNRRSGLGRFLREGLSMRVDATIGRPCPGRTLYTLPWADPTFAELEIEAIPPGTARGQGAAGRGGLVFWQDPENYLVINLWIDDSEHHDGVAISCFLVARGREDMFDAVWSNLGRRVLWGQPYRLRAAFDGQQWMAWLDDEPVMYREVTDIDPLARRLEIREVGIAANREWGDDTGTVFQSFCARGNASSQLDPPKAALR